MSQEDEKPVADRSNQPLEGQDSSQPPPGSGRPDAEPVRDQAQGVPEQIVGVVLADGKVLEFDPQRLNLEVGDSVVVDNNRDLNLGRVVFVADNKEGKPARRVIRRVGPEDLLLIRRNKKREEEAFDFCQKRIAERKLPMKLIQVAYLHGGNKAIFYFSADGRVDFRALVRDLAQQLHVRIEMRQIGVRDESKMLGGLGICGQELCCTRFLHKFVPVSIKMAKNQNLALNPQKLSGLCGRLMCCLVYEDRHYREARKDLPKVGATIETPEGAGRVTELDILRGRVYVQLESRVTPFHLAELRSGTRSEPVPARPAQPPAKEEREGDKPGEDSRGRKRKPAAGQAKQAPEPAPPKAAEPAAGPQAPAKGEADRKKRKRRSRKRSRRRKKKPKAGDSEPAGGQAGGG